MRVRVTISLISRLSFVSSWSVAQYGLYLVRSDLNLPLSVGPGAPGLRSLGVNLCDRWTPVVWTGRADAAAPAAPPSNSVSPPRAVRLDRALRAPGLLSSWAKGMALAKGEAVVVVVEGEALAPDAPGVVPLPGVWVFWASRLAFCSSTLGKRHKM